LKSSGIIELAYLNSQIGSQFQKGNRNSLIPKGT